MNPLERAEKKDIKMEKRNLKAKKARKVLSGKWTAAATTHAREEKRTKDR